MKTTPCDPASETKRLLGQFFTITNPFDCDIFHKWKALALGAMPREESILEPFAGANNIVRLARDAGIRRDWTSYDICPATDGVIQRDTLADFPSGHTVAITNPPYLAKNSATRRGMGFPDTPHEDLYQYSLERMLGACRYVAAIIPASFLTQRIMQDRLFAVSVLTCKMFEDTEVPVCLALFAPDTSADFPVFRENELLGRFHELEGKLPEPRAVIPWTFNDASGEIGLRAIDGTKTASIEFVPGADIPPESVLGTSRSITRIKFPGSARAGKIAGIIARANAVLKSYRGQTHDVLMTPFKGLRADGNFRRRLDFAMARRILNVALP